MTGILLESMQRLTKFFVVTQLLLMILLMTPS